MQIFQGVVVCSVYFLLVTNQVTFGYPAGELAGHERGHLTPDDLERKRIYERSPSHTTYEFLTQYYSFICHNKEPGYYGDPHYECRIFHVCQPDGRRDTFFCPAWTRFNNNVQICDWQYKVDAYCNARHTPHTETAHLPRNSYLLQQQPAVHTRVEVPAPDPHPPVEPDRYRNKYEQQEYYKSIYDQEPKLKFLMDDRPAVLYPKRTLLYLPQPVFTQLHTELPAEVAASLQEDNPGNTLTAKEIPVEMVQVVEETTPSGLEEPSQYENGARDPSHAIAVPPTTGYVVLQSPPEPHSGAGGGGSHGGDHAGAEGHGPPHVPSPEGGGYPAEVDHAGVIDGPVIELWIPTPFKKAI